MDAETLTDPPGTHGLWADLYRSDVSPEEADFTVIGIPYDEAASARRGARPRSAAHSLLVTTHDAVQRRPDAG